MTHPNAVVFTFRLQILTCQMMRLDMSLKVPLLALQQLQKLMERKQAEEKQLRERVKAVRWTFLGRARIEIFFARIFSRKNVLRNLIFFMFLLFFWVRDDFVFCLF